MISLHVDQNPFKPAQRPVVHADALANFQVRPRLLRHSGRYGELQRLNFLVRNGNRCPAISDNLQDPGGGDHCAAVREIKATEKAPSESCLLTSVYPGPPPSAPLLPQQNASTSLYLH